MATKPFSTKPTRCIRRVPYLLSAANMWLKLGQAEPALALYRQLADMELTEAYAKMVVRSGGGEDDRGAGAATAAAELDELAQ